MTRKLSRPDAARRHYSLVQAVIAAAFALVMLGAARLMSRAEGVPQRWVLAAAPIALLAWWAWEFYKVFRNDDEMMQADYLRKISISGMIVIVAGTAWGILERLLAAPQLPAFLLLPAFAGCYGVVSAVLSRYR